MFGYELWKNLRKYHNSSPFVIPQRKLKRDFLTQLSSGSMQVTLNEVDTIQDFERLYEKKKEQTVGVESKREKVGLVTLALSFVKGSQIPRFLSDASCF